MKNLGRNLLSMGLMLAMAFNCVNIGKCLELIGESKELKLAREDCEKSAFGKLLSREEIAKMMYYIALTQGPEKENPSDAEMKLFGKVLSEEIRWSILCYVKGLGKEFGPGLLEAFGVNRPTAKERAYAAKDSFAKAGPMESGPMRAEKCGYVAKDSLAKAGPAKSGPMRAKKSKSAAQKWDLGEEP